MTTTNELKTMIDKLRWNTKVRFIGCRNELPNKCLENEWGIVLLAQNDCKIISSHWVAYFVKDRKPYYFCSYGTPICSELKEYLRNRVPILGHTFIIQEFNSSICGELCIVFCYLLDKGIRYEDIILGLAL